MRLPTPTLLPMLACFASALIGNLFVVAQEATEIKIVAISIAREDPESDYGGAIVPGLQSGTSIFMQIRLPDRTVIKIQRIEGESFAIQDSTGKSLPDAGTDFGFMGDISSDGRTVRIPISSDEIPGRGAETISAKGSIKLICGEEPHSEEIEASITQGNKLRLAGIDFSVTEVADTFMDQQGQMFELQTRQSPARIQQIQAIMADGQVMELESAGSTEFGFGEEITYGRNFSIPGQAADITKLKVKYFKRTKELNLPFEFKTGIGF